MKAATEDAVDPPDGEADETLPALLVSRGLARIRPDAGGKRLE